jgi:methionyl aminopeptidase
MIILKTKKQIEIMDQSNKIVHDVIDELESRISIGVTTKELDQLAEKLVFKFGATPAFKGYAGYPSSLCISINDEIVHGIPSNRIIKDGDIVSIDFGAKYNGYIGDAARTIIVGKTSEQVNNLVLNTWQSLVDGVAQMIPGNYLYNISEAISLIAKENNYGNIKIFSGHGIGTDLHEDPRIFNYIDINYPNIKLREGMVFALEPMFSLGSSDAEILDDKWTAVTTDGSLSAHWEVSVAVTKDGPYVLGRPYDQLLRKIKPKI